MKDVSNARIKAAFGQALRAARDAKKISRATLAVRLGISPKTIQSWEMGRTFIEELGLIPELETELGISVSRLIALSVSGMADAKKVHPAPLPGPACPAVPSKPANDWPVARAPVHPRPGPFPLHFVRVGTLPEPEETTAMANAWSVLPVIKKSAILRGISDLLASDVFRYMIIPGDWAPRGAVMVGCRMDDSALDPVIPLGAVVALDMRPLQPEKAMGKLVALWIKDKGFRIRRLIWDKATGRMFGAPQIEHSRGRMLFRVEHGDEIIGRVVGVMSQPL